MAATIEVITTYAKPERAQIALAVSTSGMVVSVAPGTIKDKGVDYTLDEQVDYTVTPDADHDMSVVGHLVRVKADGSLDVVVDEVLNDGVDVMYEFDDASPYEMIRVLFAFDVPAAAADIETVTIKVFEVVERPSPTSSMSTKTSSPFQPPDLDNMPGPIPAPREE